MRWCIYYDDRAPFSHEDGGPEDAPGRGVQVIIQNHREVGVELVTAANYYVWDGGRWRGVDIFGLWDYLVLPGWKVVLFGRTITREEYQTIYKAVEAGKAGWLPREFKP